MGNTAHGLVYPPALGESDFWESIELLALSFEAALVAYETFTSWTPVWVDGPTTIGAGGFSEGFTHRIGDRVHAEFRVQLGTAPAFTGTTFELTLPVPAWQWSGSGQQHAIGRWMVRDSDVTKHYSGAISIHGSSSVSVDFGGCWDGTSPRKRVSSAAGIPCAGGFASGDVISGAMTYRAAP